MKSILLSIQLADGNRAQINEISLKTRKFIGNTSMDATLSLLMANQAQVKSGDLVLDPFVGTGSLLVAAAKFGGLFAYLHQFEHHYYGQTKVQIEEINS